MLRFSRSIKTLHTPTHFTNANVRSQLVSKIELLDEILSRSSYDRGVLYTPKYKRIPQLITSSDTIRTNRMIRDFVDNITMDQALDMRKQKNAEEKLGKIGLELFLECNKNLVTVLSTSLATTLMRGHNRYADEEGFLKSLTKDMEHVKAFLKRNKVMIKNPSDVDMLVDRLAFTTKDADTIKTVLRGLNYQLFSDDIVRVVRGKTTSDEVDLSKGWKYPAGILDTNEAYLRSIDLNKQNLISLNEPSIVLIHDGTLRDSDKILPTLHYAAKQKKPVVLIVNGDVTGDALTSIIINNNKNKRQSNPSRTIILKYFKRNHNNLALQENHDFVKFCQLPQGFGSIYSPAFSEFVPSSASAKLFYGTIDSIKATTGECFLYNPESAHRDVENDALRTTLTLNVGGESEFEIDQRRSSLDNILNDILCNGLSEGFVPSYGVSLTKAANYLRLQPLEPTLIARATRNIVLESLSIPMDQALKNKFDSRAFERAEYISATMALENFKDAQMPSGLQDMISNGYLEPWNKIDQCISNVMSFMKLITSCKAFVTNVFEKPKKNQ